MLSSPEKKTSGSDGITRKDFISLFYILALIVGVCQVGGGSFAAYKGDSSGPAKCGTSASGTLVFNKNIFQVLQGSILLIALLFQPRSYYMLLVVWLCPALTITIKELMSFAFQDEAEEPTPADFLIHLVQLAVVFGYLCVETGVEPKKKEPSTELMYLEMANIKLQHRKLHRLIDEITGTNKKKNNLDFKV